MCHTRHATLGIGAMMTTIATKVFSMLSAARDSADRTRRGIGSKHIPERPVAPLPIEAEAEGLDVSGGCAFVLEHMRTDASAMDVTAVVIAICSVVQRGIDANDFERLCGGLAACAELNSITAEQAKERQREHGGTAPGKKNTGGKLSTSDNGDSGKARDKAAEELGISGRQGEKMAAVADKVDELRASGKDDEANELEETLNKSVSAAHDKVKPKPKPKPKQAHPKPKDASLDYKLTKLYNEQRDVNAQHAIEFLARMYVENNLVILNAQKILDCMTKAEIRAWLEQEAA